MKKKNILIIVFLMAIIAIVGCNKNDSNNGDKKSTETKLERVDIEKVVREKYEIEFSDFNVGNEVYTSSSDRVLPYEVKGSIAVPKGEGKFPIVLITHGSHENLDESKEFYTGFDYLVKALAENGYIAVSMDMKMAYIWQYGDNDDNEKTISMANKQIEKLKLANEGNNPGYSMELTNKIDFDKVFLIGHSRGGESIFDVANDQIDKGQNIQGVLSLAPTLGFNREYGNYDISILVPEYDGDISSLDGFKIYEKIKNRNTDYLTSVTLLEKANHNYFNSNIEINDAKMIRSEEELESQLTRSTQEEFLENLSVDFFNISIFKNTENTMYDLNLEQPNKIYDCDVKIQSVNNKVNKLIDVKSTKAFKSKNATVERTQDSWFYADDKIELDTITYGNEELKIRPLINIKWKSNKDKVIITPEINDFSNNSSLVFNMVIDYSDKLNEKGMSQCFSIEIKDKLGNISKVVLPKNLVILEYSEGNLDSIEIQGKNYEFWSTTTPIGSLRLPLNKFTDIDLKNVDTISLIFDQTNSGSILIDSIELQ
ncbi:hypothetical protein ABFP60_03945 [Clostridioides difficile]